MKTRKKITPEVAGLDDVIAGGTATRLENSSEAENKDGRGRPKSTVKKKTCVFRLPLDLIEVIDANCRGNKSVFAEEVFREYFQRNNIDT